MVLAASERGLHELETARGIVGDEPGGRGNIERLFLDAGPQDRQERFPGQVLRRGAPSPL